MSNGIFRHEPRTSCELRYAHFGNRAKIPLNLRFKHYELRSACAEPTKTIQFEWWSHPAAHL